MRTAVDEVIYNTAVTRGREMSRLAYAAGAATAALGAVAVVAVVAFGTARVLARVITAMPSTR